jgi:hypothetical protein
MLICLQSAIFCASYRLVTLQIGPDRYCRVAGRADDGILALPEIPGRGRRVSGLSISTARISQ